MLEQLRRSSQSLLIYVLFGIVIAVFIVNFGPQSQGGCESSVARSTYAAKVGGGTVSARDFRYAYILAGGPQYQPQRARELRLRERILDELIERELLVAEAERLGFAVSIEEVEDLIAESKLIGLGGFEQPALAMQKDGHFDYDAFVRFVQFQLGMTPKVFIEEQQRELLAARVRNLIRNGVNVSEHEVKSEFERQSHQVNLEYMRFSWRRHEDAVELKPAEIQAYATANEKKLKELYDQRKFLYENAPRERRLRQILIKLDSGASVDATGAAEKKATALLERIKKGESFAAVARVASDDARSKLRGGDVGWRRQGATPFGAALEEKVWAAKDGEVVGPMKGNDGFYLVLPEASREGNIGFPQVHLDLAETELRQERAKDRARAEAEASLNKAKAPVAKDKSLKDLFPAPPEGLHGAETLPRAEETSFFARRGAVVEGIGIAPELAKAAFELQPASPFGGPYEVSGSYVIVKLKERKQPDQAEFEKKKAEFMHQAALSRGEQILAEWIQRRCTEAKEAKRIRVNHDILRYDDSPANERIAYEACAPPFRF
jgi:peptidyl-prolyl cis-trans isomerase D